MRSTRGGAANPGRVRSAGVIGLGCAALLVAALGGCATGTGPGGGPGSGSATAPPSPSGATPTLPGPSGPGRVPDEPGPTASGHRADLAVAVDATGSGDVTTWELTCGPDGGTHPDPDAACRALGTEAARAALDPVPRDVACTEIWGGPQTATITGVLDGEPVDAHLSRTNGCEIARWDALVAVLGTAGGA